ncbi:MAG: hypothetical protein AB7W47_11460 [Calditrichaceae bacterium]
MKTKIVLTSIMVLGFLALNLFAQGIQTNGRISNTVYSYEDTTSHTRLYQTVRFQAGLKEWGDLRFNMSGRILTDLDEDLADERRFNAYRMSISGKGLFNNLMDFELGRQFLHPGLVLGSIDGLNMIFRPIRNVEWQLYGGVESHFNKAFEIYESDDAAVYGTALKYKNFYDTDIQGVYLQKTHSGETQWQIAGLNLYNSSVNNLKIMLQTHYDLVNDRLHRFYVSGRYRMSDKFSANLYFKQQHPQIYGDSYFRIFDVESYTLSAFNGSYALTDEYYLGAEYQFLQLEDGDAQRVLLTLNNSNGTLGFIFETGDLGDQTGVTVDYGYQVTPKLLASLSVDYSQYRYEEVYDYEDQLANAVRASYSFSKNWSADLEYQWLTNREKDSDQRILNHIHFIW